MSKRTNEQWLSDLQATGLIRDDALADLREIIMAGLPFALSKWLSPGDPKFEALIEEATQDTLLRVLDRLETFEGRSQFTTWVHKIAVRMALTELRRRKWRDISLEGLTEEQDLPDTPSFMADPAHGPESNVEQADMMARVQRIITEELTDKQRQAMIAVSIQGMPLEEVARRMNTKRNALYKLLHDGRVRLKSRLAQEGLSPADVMAVFEK
jgi:RNA polymerase sigma-70 factor (ECF subfamily)